MLDANIARTFTIDSAQTAKNAAITAEQSAYASEIEAWLGSKEYRATDIAMRSNRAVGF
jgi:hypothetical protein